MQMMPVQSMPAQPMMGYSQQGMAQQGYAMQPAGQFQPASQAPRSYASNDRLPAMPGMLQRPVQQAAQPPAVRQPVIRAAAPEQQPAVAQHRQADWKPIRIPTPSELGILVKQTRTLPVNTVELPERYDLATVTLWLDRMDVRSVQRDKLLEGYQYSCLLGEGQVTVQGATDQLALQKLVQEVARQKQNTMLSQR
jgi:hypothetical protein